MFMIDMLAFNPVRVGMLETLYWSVGYELIQHAEACSLDVPVQIPFVLRSCEDGIDHLYHRRGCKLCVYRNSPRIGGILERGWFEERLYHWCQDKA